MTAAPVVAWLSAETPDRNGSGGQRRQFHQIRAILEAGGTVRVATLAGPQSDKSLRELVPVERFAARGLRRGRDIPVYVEDADVAVVAHVESMSYFRRGLARLDIPFAIDFHNVYSRWSRLRSDRGRAVRWRAVERRALAAADQAFVCSEQEASELRQAARGTPVEVAGNGIAVEEWPSTNLERQTALAMFGAWTHGPNREGLSWFATHAWSRILEAVPEARLLLLGPGVPPSVARAEQLGRVDSLSDVLGRVRVAIVPIHRGMGSRVKFGEALASGAAVVSTAEGAEGFDADGVYARADDGGSFAQACIDLLRYEDQARELGRRGRDFALSHLTWTQTSKPLTEWIRSVLA